MNARDILEEAAGLQSQLVAIRRDLHQHPELGFDLKYTKELVKQELIKMGYAPQECGKAGLTVLAGGSEDFAFVSQEVPTVSLFLSAGNSQEGYRYSQHNPKVRFDDSVLSKGSAAYVYGAMRYLEEI